MRTRQLLLMLAALAYLAAVNAHKAAVEDDDLPPMADPSDPVDLKDQLKSFSSKKEETQDGIEVP